MTNEVQWADDIYREKSLWDVWKASRVIPSTRFNYRVVCICWCIAVVYVLANLVLGVDNKEVLGAITRLSAALVSISTAILGFLIAGFSIFIASTPKDVSRKLIATRYRKTSISWFKQIMFNFLNVFTVYLFVLVLAGFISTVTPLGWVPALHKTMIITTNLVAVFNSAVLASMAVLAIYAALRLKSFIWTMYQGLLVNIQL